MTKPFLKWAGGKSGLLDEITKRLPNYVYHTDFCLVEAFIGGGALSFWALSHLPHLKKLIINDYNSDLINVYQIIKQNPNKLIEHINTLQEEYDNLNNAESKNLIFIKKESCLIQEQAIVLIKQVCLFF